MTVLTEGHLQLTLPPGVVGRKFDDASHGLSHCMQAVDFIIELPNQIWFVEFKDPEAGTEPNQQHIEQFLSGTLDHTLKTKLRDSWLYEWACGRTDKPIHFYVLIGACTLTKRDLLRRLSGHESGNLESDLSGLSCPTDQPISRNPRSTRHTP
ncbi:MAG: hypothetical protein HQL96_14210 [Magnetococcales bacterium]|nr:hypothetical protein [Magnetococcales bacterium]